VWFDVPSAITWCLQAELAGLPADLLVVVDMLPALVLETLPQVAAVLDNILSRCSTIVG
jgi:hypothetical protein